jgi:hypothetical protein
MRKVLILGAESYANIARFDSIGQSFRRLVGYSCRQFLLIALA